MQPGTQAEMQVNTPLARSWVELGTESESLLQVLGENTNLGGHAAAGTPHGKNWNYSLKLSQKTDDGTLSEFCGKEQRWGLGNSHSFQDPHPHLLNIAGSKYSLGDNALRVLSRPKAPRLYGSPLD